MITTRTATRADLPTLLEFEQGIVTFERPFDPTIKPDPVSYYDIGEMIDADWAEVVVAVDGERIVGSGYAKDKASDHYVMPEVHCFLGFMFTDPDYRGQGVNGLVNQALLQWAKDRGHTEVRLRVYDENAGALRAYEKVGFRRFMVEMRMGV